MNVETAQQRLEQYRKAMSKAPQLLQPAQLLFNNGNDVQSMVLCHVFAPALGAFTRWLLQSSIRDGIRRLYFLARDGYFFYRAAQFCCSYFHLPLECKYLFCSRYALRLPLFHRNLDQALDYICRSGLSVTIHTVLKRAGLSHAEIAQMRSLLQIDDTHHLSNLELAQLKRSLRHCDRFLEWMNAHSKQAFSYMEGYLLQQDIGNTPFDAIVDSGWTGTMQRSMQEALETIGLSTQLRGYYWGLYELPHKAQPTAYQCYYFAPKGNLQQKVYFNNCLFEAVFSAPHGMTVGYRKEGTSYLPKLATIPQVNQTFLQECESIFREYIRLLAMGSYLKTEDRFDRKTLYQLFKLFMCTPTPQEADCFGSLLFSDDVLEGMERPLATPLTQTELNTNHLWTRVWNKLSPTANFLQESGWYEASALQNGSHTSHHLLQNRWYQYVRHAQTILRNRKEQLCRKNTNSISL